MPFAFLADLLKAKESYQAVWEELSAHAEPILTASVAVFPGSVGKGNDAEWCCPSALNTDV